jgi:membrane associated rhomboid family serine protease
MFPLRDSTPSGSVPIVTVCLIIVNSVLWLYEVSLQDQLERFILEYGLIPLQFVQAFRQGGGMWSHVVAPLVSSMFLHAGWMPVIVNMWLRWIFGDNIEDRLGHFKYLLFYLLCGIGASLLHVAFQPHSKLPMVGASGAISGVLGAYLISYPYARVHTLLIIFVLIRFVEVPAFLFLIFWFILQLVAGTSQLPARGEVGGVAYWAHMGGFVVGIILLLIMPKRSRRRDRQTRRGVVFRL